MPVGKLLKDPEAVRAFQERVREELSSTGWFRVCSNHDYKTELPSHDIDVSANSWASSIVNAAIATGVMRIK